ncbi:MAG: response regulator [Patescibacteria group bacterium]
MTKLKILLVDDDRRQLEDWGELLHSNKHEVVFAHDGVEAVKKYDSSIDFVLTDYQMPDKGGIEVLCEIKEINPDARIWIHTQMKGDSFGHKKDEALMLGAEKFLHKNETASALVAAGIIR